MDKAYLEGRKAWHQSQLRDKVSKIKKFQKELDDLVKLCILHEGAEKELDTALENLEKSASGAENPGVGDQIVNLP